MPSTTAEIVAASVAFLFVRVFSYVCVGGCTCVSVRVLGCVGLCGSRRVCGSDKGPGTHDDLSVDDSWWSELESMPLISDAVGDDVATGSGVGCFDVAEGSNVVASTAGALDCSIIGGCVGNADGTAIATVIGAAVGASVGSLIGVGALVEAVMGTVVGDAMGAAVGDTVTCETPALIA